MLSHPGDAWSFDIFTQAGRALAADDGDGPLGPLTPARVLAIGESQSAAFLVTYINAVDAHAEVYDGFFVHGRGASGAGLDGFRMASPDDVDVASAVAEQPGEAIRDDLRVPVLVLQSETDVALLGGGRAGQRDSERLRQWEIAGAAHADTYLVIAGNSDDGTLAPERLAELLAADRGGPRHADRVADQLGPAAALRRPGGTRAPRRVGGGRRRATGRAPARPRRGGQRLPP